MPDSLRNNNQTEVNPIQQLISWETLTPEDLGYILTTKEKSVRQMIFAAARQVRERYYGNSVYIRGLIEISNYCVRNCNYCGIRQSKKMDRYRLTKNDIMSLVELLIEHDITTIVLQGGEDPYFTDDVLVDIIASIKERYPDVAITLSLGERSKHSYKRLKTAGADRYLLRHETATRDHYSFLHPEGMSLSNRINCLKNLKELEFQTGAGMMVSSPKQTINNKINDLLFLQKLQPEMIGIGPFIAAKQTPFSKYESGTVRDACLMVAIARLLVPKALIPATTALQSLAADGYKQGLLAGANVVMINVSPKVNQPKYAIYDNKLKSDKTLRERLSDLDALCKEVGLEMDLSVGHFKEERI